MKAYKNKKGKGVYSILSYIITVNLCTLLLINLIDIYVILSLIKVFLILANVYGIYYLFLNFTLKYLLDDENLYIVGLWGLKKIIIPFSSIEGYKCSKDIIHGVKLSGIGRNNFALGRFVVDKIGTTRMFVTCSKGVIYLKTEDVNYAISPENTEEFKKLLEKKGSEYLDWEYKPNKELSLHKEKEFMLPFILVSVIIVIFTLTPFILYLKQMLPAEMPINFNAKFEAVKMGTGKQFAFKQMTYGVLNMAILFCMYYAAHFHAKYDKKSAHRYIYASLIISSAFFLMQIKTLLQFI
ncbi:PH domain-containing protein [Clostridium ganghwense]|uniref:PH domain-containing protein n=1 Tax=Clostridium ganghwense TaxID=312089 RepID=A0ABT4CRY5_9CLOT|nr:PH domain-containing protein [Clostridium ganghwense]MCY6371802.1 PH domain-containing protein [Clostridium ganghwense]